MDEYSITSVAGTIVKLFGGAHGDNIPADMDIAHFWKFQPGGTEPV
ncbi:MAG: hypothetical protein Q7R35_11195 [Elusimicrobiota bacterium]|nr:hypothetical protein [Elusimicrobiota bacterium]